MNKIYLLPQVTFAEKDNDIDEEYNDNDSEIGDPDQDAELIDEAMVEFLEEERAKAEAEQTIHVHVKADEVE